MKMGITLKGFERNEDYFKILYECSGQKGNAIITNEIEIISDDWNKILTGSINISDVKGTSVADVLHKITLHCEAMLEAINKQTENTDVLNIPYYK